MSPARKVRKSAVPKKAAAGPDLIPEKALIMSGYGINSEMETQEALARAGMGSDIVHINDLIDGRFSMADYRLLVFPGGFSYGDDTGAGNAYANRVRNNLWKDVEEFLDGDNLVLGICNGFQILANLGLVPAFDRKYKREIALMPNRKGVLECRFVTLKPAAENLWTKGIERIYCPVSHGEGNFSCSKETLEKIRRRKMIAFTYCRDDLSPADGEYPYNPNGSLEDIAGITSADGKVLGLMPHPERAMEFVNLYDWPLRKEQMRRAGVAVPAESMNMRFFRNIVEKFR
ncbi:MULTISPECIES: phosphoribosylformylglycinamidine synthase subunit PurQ [unclassified Methanoregula]|uniref:phosphoribosylformylglycinamidine synthase subunit PurQ n=1 Tax=unclassified Methanoregula TaxID=2649730 RepID=UPI0009CAE028|nr:MULTISPECIES: phosphoribosylformylglycinamidine synthase subunit PurQ [unclassified Methanoregula]OPX62995.1 MAG: phosphoribosylformylglycinamidine synthase I [Methanoregula sp. PtaB.Bin085]OPY31573.1 MAG: phosphoribosylformylglycinamidine synthase I [Methanoregula sp. PtaU1.Bin006]